MIDIFLQIPKISSCMTHGTGYGVATGTGPGKEREGEPVGASKPPVVIPLATMTWAQILNAPPSSVTNWEKAHPTSDKDKKLPRQS